jgi:Lon protease-like protein
MIAFYFAREAKKRIRIERSHHDAPRIERTIVFHLRRCAIGDRLASLLGLFPLDLVLLPGTPLPLHIFEPRYKEMIGECMAQNLPFGIVRAVDKGIAEIGCTVEIVTVTKEHPDGRLDIITQGRRRFEVLQLNQERSFLRADVLFVDDEPEAAASDQTARAVQLHADILELAGAVQDLSAAEPRTLSYYLAGSLPLDLDFKQKLLAMRSERTRIQMLVTYLEAVVPNVKRAARAREKAGGNGHAH